MNTCQENRMRMWLYLDDELRDQEMTGFEAHVAICEECRQALDLERRFVENVRTAGSLCVASGELRSRVMKTLQEAPVYRAPARLRARVERVVGQAQESRSLFAWHAPRAAWAFLLMVGVMSGAWWALQKNAAHLEFATIAAAAHSGHLSGRLPLEVKSASPEAISSWFANKLTFRLRLPLDEDMPASQRPYQLEGARLVAFHNDYAAYIAYRVGTKSVGLLAVPTEQAKRLYGNSVRIKSLTFYYNSLKGFHVITWSAPKKGVTYALVSDASEPKNESCIVCHGGAKDRDFMRQLLN